MPGYVPKIFVSSIYKLKIGSPQRFIKEEIFARIKGLGFEPQSFLESGLPEGTSWSPEEAIKVMQRCDGAVIIGLSRYTVTTENGIKGIPTEYNHYEGALAASLKLPLLVISENGLEQRGIFYEGGGHLYATLETNPDKNWFDTDEYFNRALTQWGKKVSDRNQVFVGYCGAAGTAALNLINFLEVNLKLKVMHYKGGFIPGKSILQSIADSEETSQCAIFLFTSDDELVSTQQYAPRDNVIFEAGYFINAKGKDRVLIIKEVGAKMLDDLGGDIYLPLTNRDDLSNITAGIEKFLIHSLFEGR